MVVTVDLKGVRAPTSDDYAGLWAYLQQLVGQPFLFLRASYGDELTLHLGTPLPHVSPKLKRPRGSYVLTFRGSAWLLRSGAGRLTVSGPLAALPPADWQPMTLEEFERVQTVEPGALVVGALPFTDPQTGGYGIILSFSDASIVQLRPAPEESPAPDEENLPPIADWELFTPYGRYLRVGPGTKWSYQPSTATSPAPSPTEPGAVPAPPSAV